MSAGSVPEAFTGTIKEVKGVLTNDGKNELDAKGQLKEIWKLQTIVITDGKSDIEVLMSKRDDVHRNAIGSTIHVTAAQGQRGLMGIKRKDNLWKGVTKPQVEVGDRADVSFSSNGNQSAPPQTRQTAPSTPQSRIPATAAAPARQAPPPSQNGNGHTNGSHENTVAEAQPDPKPGMTKEEANALRMEQIKNFKKRIAKSASAYEGCIDAAFALAKKMNEKHAALGGFKPEASTIEKMAACLMVQASWGTKPADIEFFPMKSFETYTAEPSKPAGAPFN